MQIKQTKRLLGIEKNKGRTKTREEIIKVDCGPHLHLAVNSECSEIEIGTEIGRYR
jgi:hypothetical protein